MELSTKTQISKVTLSLLVVVVFLFLLGLIVVTLCAGLSINPFKETTTSFLIASFTGLIGIATILVLLNVATNVSLIADAKIAELRVEPKQSWMNKWLLAFVASAFILVALVFGGSYLSKRKYLGIVYSQAEEVVEKNKDVLEEVSRLLASGKARDYKRISEIQSFLQNQRNGMPELTVIYSGKFADKLAFYQIGSYVGRDEDEKGTYTPVYFPCTKNLDCDYLTKFFSGESLGRLQRYTFRDDEFYIYVPVPGKQARFVLLFERKNSYGKVGSS